MFDSYFINFSDGYPGFSNGDIEYGGQADAYITWVADAVIPYLRKCFRISQDRKDIGIAGASFGGLVSLYALFKHAILV